MKEKVLYVNLPDGASCRRVVVTEDGRIGIVYTEQCVNNEESTKAPLTSWIPKPVPLIGGTEVYQKENGTPYWYCKIKKGRDEFMHVYFDDLTENDLLYDTNGMKRQFVTIKQEKFKADVREALKNKPKEGYRWIPVYEPGKNSKGNLCYIAGKELLRALNSYEWEKKFEEYSPKNGSREASITTYFLLLLRWLKDGIATIEQLADNSKEIGHFWNSEDAKYNFEKTGEREFGGLYGFAGNSYKIVKDSESSSGFSLVGGNYSTFGNKYPLADVVCDIAPLETKNLGVGLLELTK